MKWNWLTIWLFIILASVFCCALIAITHQFSVIQQPVKPPVYISYKPVSSLYKLPQFQHLTIINYIAVENILEEVGTNLKGELSNDGQRLLYQNNNSCAKTIIEIYDFNTGNNSVIKDPNEPGNALNVSAAYWDPINPQYLYCFTYDYIHSCPILWHIRYDNTHYKRIQSTIEQGPISPNGKEGFYIENRLNVDQHIDYIYISQIRTRRKEELPMHNFSPFTFSPDARYILGYDTEYNSEVIYDRILKILIPNFAKESTLFSFPSDKWGVSSAGSYWLPDSSGVLHDVKSQKDSHQIWLSTVTGNVFCVDSSGLAIQASSGNGRYWLLKSGIGCNLVRIDK